MSNLYSALPPLFRPRQSEDLSVPDTSSKVSKVPALAVNVRHGSYSFPWPDEVGGLGPRRVGAFDRCEKCGLGSWIRYGSTVLCVTCAKGGSA